MNNNNFETLAGALAQILIEKNHAYNNSYDDTVDTYGLRTIGVRLEDKYNRIKNLLLRNELGENDEKLIDSLLDNAGYSILAINYLIKRGKVSQEDRQKFDNGSRTFYDAVYQEMYTKKKQQEEAKNNNLNPHQVSSIDK